MKGKLIAILVGTVVLAAPFVKLASAQTMHSPMMMPGVELTQEQQTQLAELRDQTRTQAEEILTEEQRSQFRSAMEQGQPLRQAIAAANLSAEQQTQLRSIFESAHTQLEDVLTNEQRQQLRQNLRSRFGTGEPQPRQ